MNIYEVQSYVLGNQYHLNIDGRGAINWHRGAQGAISTITMRSTTVGELFDIPINKAPQLRKHSEIFKSVVHLPKTGRGL